MLGMRWEVACRAGLALLLGLGVSAPRAAAADDSSRSRLVPIRLAVNKSKLVYSIRVHFTTRTLDAVLDTGSLPLLVLDGRLSRRDGTATGANSSVTYGGDRTYDYNVERGSVRVGADQRTIDFGIVSQAHCVPPQSQCPIAGENAHTALFAGLHPAIAGARMPTATDTAPTIFPQLGVQRFVVTAPRQGEGDGTLQLDPDANATSGFVPIYDDTSTGAPDGSVRGCLRNKTTGAFYCGAVFLDSGRTGIEITPAAGGIRSTWTAKDAGQLEFIGDGNAEVAGVDFTVGADAPTAVTIDAPGQTSEPVIKVGQLPYIGLSILTDLANGTYAVAPRKRARDGVTGHVP